MALRQHLARLWRRGDEGPARSAEVRGLLDRIKKVEADIARRTVYLGDHEALTRLTTGQKLYVDTRDASIAAHLMIDGCWEPWIASVIAERVKPGMRVADIGANFGYYAVTMGSAVGPTGRVWAVEVNPRMTALLRKSLRVNGLERWTSVVESAAWDRRETLEIVVNDAYSGGGRVRRRVGDGKGRMSVEAVPLDDVFEPPLQFIKIDVEGAEERALKGLARVIDASGPMAIVMEYFHRGFPEPAAFFADFARRGFRARVIHPRGLGADRAPEALVAELGEQLGYVLLERG